jgi:hypothetical protein
MNIEKMLLIKGWSESYLRFKYYGSFETMKWIVDDCVEDLQYIGNSNIDGAPVFIYTLFNIDCDLLYDFKKLNVYLRDLKLRHYTKKDLTKKERSMLTFFKFFMNSDENKMIKGVYDLEIKRIYDCGDDNYTSTSPSSSSSGT